MDSIFSEVCVAICPSQRGKIDQIEVPLHDLGKRIFRIGVSVAGKQFGIVGHRFFITKNRGSANRTTER